MFKVTETILDRAELVWCSVQTWVGGLGRGGGLISRSGVGPGHWGNRRDPHLPSVRNSSLIVQPLGTQKFNPYSDLFTLSSSKGCFLKAYLILKDALGLFHLFQSQLLLLRGPGDLPIAQTKPTGPPDL